MSSQPLMNVEHYHTDRSYENAMREDEFCDDGCQGQPSVISIGIRCIPVDVDDSL